MARGEGSPAPLREGAGVVAELRFAAGSETLAATRYGDVPRVLSFHGTGRTASRGGIRYLLETLGAPSACFDFSGHGESSGSFEESTLRKRIDEAAEAARVLCPPSPRAILGTSMGAHIAAVLTPRLRPRTLVFFCPAAYPTAVDDVPVTTLRPTSLSSPAFAALRDFDGTLLIVAGREDTVAGPEIVEAYLRSAPAAASKVIWLKGCGHAVHPWLREHETERVMVLDEIARAI